MLLKADTTELKNYILKSGLTSDLDMKNHDINNVKEATSGHQAVNFTQLNNELSNYLQETCGTMKGDIQMDNNHIYGVNLSIDNTSAVPRKYIDDKLKTKINISGGNFTGNISMGGNKIITYRNLSDLQELVPKSYVDQKVSQAISNIVITGDLNMNDNRLTNLKNGRIGSNHAVTMNFCTIELATRPNVNQLILRDGSQSMSNDLNLNDNKLINVKKASLNSDAVNLEQPNEANSVLVTTVSKSYLKKDCTTLLTAHLNLDNHKITNLQEGNQLNNAITYNQLQSSHIQPTKVDTNNVLKHVMISASQITADKNTIINGIIDYSGISYK